MLFAVCELVTLFQVYFFCALISSFFLFLSLHTAITDDIQVVFYVYVNLDAHQTAGQQAAPATRTIMTCHVPVYYD